MNLVTIEHLTKSYTDRLLFNDAAFSINEGEKAGLLGVNGTGKSTLLKILSGLEEADGGSVVCRRNLYIRYLPQEPEFKEDDTVLESIIRNNEKEVHYSFREEMQAEVKSMLNELGIEDHDAKMETLSGGQRKRVALASVLLSRAELLLMDEPTNHLDSDMADWLEEYLKNFKGTLLMITHDRYFLDRVVNRIFAFEGQGKIVQYEGGFTDYQNAVKKKEETEEIIGKGGSVVPVKAVLNQSTKKGNWKDTGNVPKKKKLTFKEQKDWETIEDDIAVLEAAIEGLDQEMDKSASNYARLNELMVEKETRENELEKKMKRWIYLNELIEEIEAQN